jgi:hypothetical protein
MKRGRLAQFKQLKDRLPASLGRRASCLTGACQSNCPPKKAKIPRPNRV